MQRLEDRDHVEALGEVRIGSVALVKPDAALDAGAGEVLLRLFDRRLVEVDAVHRDLRVGAPDRDARPAAAAGDVGDASGRIRLEPLVQLWHRR